MKSTKSSSKSDSRITAAVQSVWENAGFDTPVKGIVPLNTLISSYPIWMGEVRLLNMREARQYITRKIGSNLVMDMDGTDPLSGFLFAQLTGVMATGCILVDANDILARRRFSAAHELGHYVLHFLPVLKAFKKAGKEELIVSEGLTYETQAESTGDEPGAEWWGTQQVLPGMEVVENMMVFTEDWQETEANRFAAELLMPKSACLEMIEIYKIPYGRNRDTIASRISGELLVSKEAVLWRLVSLGI
jgi:hypothetical protein